MDWAEQHAQKYLQTLSDCVAYEPDGNVPPDFLVDGRIAVEVRRLNQNEVAAGLTRGLEETSIPLWQGLTRLLEQQGAPLNDGLSWWVTLDFRRPISPWPQLRTKVLAVLQSFEGRGAATHSFQIESNLEMELRHTSTTHERRFMPGGYHDADSGGWLLSEVLRNLRICLAEKTAKIAPYRTRYKEWWLLLIDHIGFGLQDYERNLMRDHSPDLGGWDKVILLDPRDHARAFEI